MSTGRSASVPWPRQKKLRWRRVSPLPIHWLWMPMNGSTSRTIPESLWWQMQARWEMRCRSAAPILCPVNAVPVESEDKVRLPAHWPLRSGLILQSSVWEELRARIRTGHRDQAGDLGIVYVSQPDCAVGDCERYRRGESGMGRTAAFVARSQLPG